MKRWMVMVAALATFLGLYSVSNASEDPFAPLVDIVERLEKIAEEMKTVAASLEQPAAPIPDTGLIVTVPRGNVRSGPGATYDVIATVARGDVLQGPLQESDGWYQVCCVNGEENGWMSASLVREEGSAEAATEESECFIFRPSEETQLAYYRLTGLDLEDAQAIMTGITYLRRDNRVSESAQGRTTGRTV